MPNSNDPKPDETLVPPSPPPVPPSDSQQQETLALPPRKSSDANAPANDSQHEETLASPSPNLLSPSVDVLSETVVKPPVRSPVEPLAPLTKVGSATVSPGQSDAGLPGAPESFEILHELGRGAMGVVYKARQKALNRLVALKMVLGGGHASREELDRFRNEAEVIAKLSHSAIVQVYEIGEHGGMPYFAMEYCPGGSLSGHASGHPLDPKRAAQLVRTLAEGMYHAHQAGVIHRDLKPSNVLVVQHDDAGRPLDGPGDLTEVIRGTKGDLSAVALKIADFGLARQLEGSGHTRTGDLLGTPSYMAPEQAAARLSDIAPTTDVWALGAILYDLLTGRPPFRGSTVMETVRLVIEKEPVAPRALRPELPRDLETICLKCLQKEQGKRYTTAKELADDLGRFVEGRPILARPVGVVERTVRWARRKPALAALSSVLVLTVIGALIGWGVYTAELDRERRRADRKADEALANYRLAEERFLLAMGVVDRYFTEVSESTLLHEAGMLPLRRSLLKNARGFYAEFVRMRDGEEKLTRELVRSQYRLGLIDADLGDAKGAVILFNDALTRLDAIEEDDAAREDRALILHHRGRILRQPLLRNDEAGKSYSSALEIWRELKKGKDEARYRAGEATTLLGLGNVATVRRDYPLAQKRYSEVVELRRTLVASDPKNETYQRDLATAYQNLAAVAQAGNDAKTASAARAEALATQQTLVKQFPGRAKYREDLGMSWYNRGDHELLANKPADAVASYQQGIQLFSALALAHPEVPGYRGRLADAYGNQAFSYERTNRPADALRVRRLAIEARRDLAKDFPDAVEHELGLIRGLRQAGERSLALEEATEARAYLTEARQRLDALVAKESAGDSRLLRAEILHEVGRVELREERYTAAKDAFRAALTMLEKDRPPGSFAVEASCYNNLALIARLTGEPEKALPLYVGVDSAVQSMRKNPRLTAVANHYTEESLRGRAQALDEAGQREAALAQWGELLKRQTGAAKTLTEARRLVTLAGTAKVDEAVTQGEKLASGATAAVRYELARMHARAAVQYSKAEKLTDQERSIRVKARRGSALALLLGLSKEGEFVPKSAHRRLMNEADFAELKSSEEWKGLSKK